MKSLLRLKRFSDWIFVLLFTVIVGVFFYRTIVFGKLPVPSDALVGLYSPYRDAYAVQYPNGIPFKNFLITDPIRQQIPWRKSFTDSLRQGKISLWDPYSFSGAPLLANIQSGALYPLNILFLLFPFAAAWTMLIISQPLLSGIFLYIYLRHKKLGNLPSLFGAICFSFSGFSIAWLTWGTMISSWLWTPLTLLAVDNIFDEKNRNRMVWAFIAGLSIACSFFAGHSQIFLYSTLFIVLYTLWFHRRAFLLRNSYMYLTGLCVVYILIAPQMFRIIEWFPQTSRLLTSSAWQSEGFFIPFRHLVQFIAPDYFGNPATLNYWGMWNYGEMVGYVGVGGLLLALIGIGSQTMFWLFMVIISLLFAVASPVAYLPFQLHLPLISSLQPTRLLVIIDFSLSVLAAYGLSAITDTIKHKKAFQWVSVLFLLLVVLWFGAFAPKLFGIPLDKVILIKRNLVVPTVIFIGSGLLLMLLITLKRHNKFLPLLTSCIILFTVVDLFRFGWKFTPFTDTSYFFPTTKIISYLQKQPKPFRIMTTDDRILPPNVNEFYGIESINGYDPLYSSRYEEFAAAMGRGSPNISPPFGFNRILVPKNVQSPLLPLFNVQYVLSFDDLSRMGFQKVLTEGKTMLFVAPNFLPRAYLVEQPIFLINKQAIMNKLYNPAFKPGISAVVEYPVQTINVPLTTSETVEIKRYADDQISFKVSTMVPRLLVVSNSYISGWHAYIDKKATAIYRTNYVFMGVLVPTGSHSVDLIYR